MALFSRRGKVHSKSDGHEEALINPKKAGSLEAHSGGGLWRRGLSRLRDALGRPFEKARSARRSQEEFLSDVEEVLVQADVGVRLAMRIVEDLRSLGGTTRVVGSPKVEVSVLREGLKKKLLSELEKGGNAVGGECQEMKEKSDILGTPRVVMVVGVNGVGKTTSLAKLAFRFQKEGKKVLLVAGDTFRAAAIEQLSVWATRLETEVIKHEHGSAPSAVVFDGIQAALARKVDVVLIDTAGRLHTRQPLMEELRKVVRVIGKQIPGAPHETILVLDACTGQNALLQAKNFHAAVPLTGIILAKMDGSAKGGIVFSVSEELGIPIQYVGLGEKIDEFERFSAGAFVEALFHLDEPNNLLDEGTVTQ